MKCLELISNKEHLTEEGLNKILSIKSGLNLGLSEKLKLKFPNVKHIARPDYHASDKPLDPNWVSGFTDGDVFFMCQLFQVLIK